MDYKPRQVLDLGWPVGWISYYAADLRKNVRGQALSGKQRQALLEAKRQIESLLADGEHHAA